MVKTLITAVALASAAFSAHADPVFSVTPGMMSDLAATPGYQGPMFSPSIVTRGNLLLSELGNVTYEYIGSEASFNNTYRFIAGTQSFTTPGGGGVFVNCTTACTKGPFVSGPGLLDFVFQSGAGPSIANGANNNPNPIFEPSFAVLLRDANRTAYLFFNDTGNFLDMDRDDMIIRVSVAAVPEPSTYAMLLAGLGILFGIMRHRKKGMT